jgi:hypothetical protein
MKSPGYPPTFAVAIVLLCLWLPFHADTARALSSLSPALDRQPTKAEPPSSANLVLIPGPLRSLMRMAGISQEAAPEDVLPLLARNIYSLGYLHNKPTEYLILLDRYVQQARKLQALAGASGVLSVANCDEAGPLLQVLGYRLRQGCGHKGASLVVDDPERAFLASDSGFPLTDLEEALENNTRFTYAFHATQVPVISEESDWTNLSTQKKRVPPSVIDALLHDPGAAHLYRALGQMDPETAMILHQTLGLKRLLPYAGVLDFYGSQICIRQGRVLVPGGKAAEAGWKDLTGSSPESAPEFVERLVAKDNGWLAAYFDSLSRISQEQQSHFTQLPRLKRLYEVFREEDLHDTATGAAFRPAPALLLLLTRLQWDPNGAPLMPGGLDAWKQILDQKTDSKVIHDWGRRAARWNSPEQMLDAMFAFSRIPTETGPLQLYLNLSAIDSGRPADEQLSPQTVLAMAKQFDEFSGWYLTFSEFPQLSDASIALFLKTADEIDGAPRESFHADELGLLQANIGLWKIFARQQQIPSAQLNDSWQRTITPFATISSSSQLFDAARASLSSLVAATTGKPDLSQEELIDLLAGPAQETAENQRMHVELANQLRSALDAQRLVSVDTLLALGDGLSEMEKGASVSGRLLPLAAELREFEMPRPIFTSSERAQWAPGVYHNPHAELQARTDLAKVLKRPSSHGELDEARGELSSFLRDTLVGLNYAYYEPPNAQLFQNDPLLVRSHDFSGATMATSERDAELAWQPAEVVNAGAPAGGGAYLMGSLADLPYVLATVEQDFIAPENIQALVWKEVAPDLLASSTLSRWWNVSQSELHAVALYQRSGEELLTASAGSEQLRGRLMDILSDRMAPRDLERLQQALEAKDQEEMLARVTPADTFYLTIEFRRKYPGEPASLGAANRELEDLCRQNPNDVSWERLSRDFGEPHPALAQSDSRELMNVKPFPAFGGTSSRFFAESWESTNLYWARLADEMGYSPVMLNSLVPELTKRMVAKIFASNFEDWQALLEAMQQTGAEFRQGKVALLDAPDPAARR